MKESSFVNTIDLYGLSPHLFIREKTKETSHIGACATILSFVAIANIVIYYFITFLTGVGMTIISSVDNVSHPISFDFKEKLLMFKFMDSNFNPVDSRIAKFSIVNTKYEKGSISNTDVPVTQCAININGNDNNYLCLNGNSNQTTLAYNNLNYIGSFFYLLLSKCINTTNDQSCLPQKSIEEYLRSQTLFLSLRVDDSKIDHRQKTTPLDSTPFQINIRITPYNIVDTQLFWKTIEYKSNEGFLCNFGLSVLLYPSNKAYSLCGTPNYFAPEMIVNNAHDQRVDWWGFGIFLYKMLCGHTPFYDNNSNTQYEKIINSNVVYPEYLSKEAVELIGGLLRKDPDKRLGRNKGFKEIRIMEFYSGIDIERIKDKRTVSPLLKMIRGNRKVEFEVMELKEIKEEELFAAEKDEREMLERYKEVFSDFD